ncbi:LTR copia-type gag-polypeptide [Tanacetum coccineum]
MGDDGKKENTKTDATQPDHNSPYYLHPSDYPRQMHVNDALTDSNYLDWVQEMENFLFAKNKMGFIDGTIKRPEAGDAKQMAWMRCDAMIKGWLTTAMEKEIRGSVKYATSASEIWKDLKERFGKESAPRAYELKQAISNTKQEGMTVSAYYTKLRGLWDEMKSFLPIPICKCKGCTCDIGKSLRELKEKEQLYEFLMGLDGEFSIIRTQILATKPIASLGNAYHLVAEDEKQRAIVGGRKPMNETMAFQASMKRGGPSNRGSQKEEKSATQCGECGRDGHTRDGFSEALLLQKTSLYKVEPPRTANMAGLRRGIPLDVVGAKMGLYQMGMLGTRRRAMIVTSDLWHKWLRHASDDNGTKGYKIYDPSNGKIITSRDVRFAEKVFPFATKFEQDSAHEMEGRSSAKLSWMEKTGLLNQHDSGRGEFRPKRQESLSINADELGRIRSY